MGYKSPTYKKGYTAPLSVAKEIVKCLREHEVYIEDLDQIIVTSLTEFHTLQDTGNDFWYQIDLTKCYYAFEDDEWDIDGGWQDYAYAHDHFYDVDDEHRPKNHTRRPFFIIDNKKFNSPFNRNSG